MKDSCGQEKQVLWDFRNARPTALESTEAETLSVMAYLFGRGMNQDEGTEKEPELRITSKVLGSFTRPNAKETLYYVGGCGSDMGIVPNFFCSHAEWWNAGAIAIFDGTKPVAKAYKALGHEVVGVTDVNCDGISEVLSSFGFCGWGTCEFTLDLGQISNGEYVAIKNFGSVNVDGCDGFPPPGMMASRGAVITYTPTRSGNMPEFTVEYYGRVCDATDWQSISKELFENPLMQLGEPPKQGDLDE